MLTVMDESIQVEHLSQPFIKLNNMKKLSVSEGMQQ